jgi:hypothetical protein
VYLMGQSTYYGSFLNATLLGVGILLLSIGSTSSHIPMRIGLFTTILCLCLGIGYVSLLFSHSESVRPLKLDYAFYVFGLGTTLGIIGCALGWPKPVPAVAYPGVAQPGGGVAAPMGQPMAVQPARCRGCHSPLRWIPEYNRYYCDACRQYV